MEKKSQVSFFGEIRTC